MNRLALLIALLLTTATAQAGFTSGQTPDLVIGGMEAAGLFSAKDIAVDPVQQKVFVADGARHRVLRFSSAASLQNGGLAEAVFGAADMDELLPGAGTNQLNDPSGICVDAGGRLWVADTGNSRVLRFDNALTASSGAAASVVLGQPNFTSTDFGTAANRMKSPQDVEMDAAGRLWVADSSNSRVLRFDNAASRSSGVNADGVLGQTSMTGGFSGGTETEFNTPTGLAVENSGGTTVRLWVVDWYNNRVLGFNNPGAKINGAPSDKLLGQSVYGATPGAGGPSRLNRPYKAAMDNGGLWVADFNNHRALYFTAAGSKAIGANADLVLGQIDFNSASMSESAGGLTLPTSIAAFAGRLWIGDTTNRVVRHDNAATKGNGTDADGVLGRKSFARPTFLGANEVLVESVSGKLFMSDASGNRVLRFPAAPSLTADSVPEAVLGQPDFNTTTGGTTASKMDGPGSLAYDGLGNLWVADARNHRVLRFANATTIASGTAASQVLGQATFTAAGSGLGASRLNTPSGLAVEWGFNATFQTVVRRLWVSDRNNHRVLRFDSPITLGNGGAASGVLGASNLTTAGTHPLSASGLYFPGCLAVDFITGRLWVADTGNERVLRFEAAVNKPNNGNADGVLLQPNFTTNNAATGTLVSGLGLGASDTLYLSRYDQKDIAWYQSAHTQPATVVPDGSFGDPAKVYGTYQGASRVALDSAGHIWVANGNLLRFSPGLSSRITAFGFNPQNRFTLTISGPQGEQYDIRSSTDLLDWSTIERTDTMPAGGILTWTATAPPSGPKKFYRLQGR